MKIVGSWNLRFDLRPVNWGLPYLKTATKKVFDDVAIYYRGSWFRPIVFGKGKVQSGESWEIRDFYKGLGLCVAVYFTRQPSYKRHRIIYSVWGEKVRWGCRYFTLEDICTMMELMEYYYTDAELGR